MAIVCTLTVQYNANGGSGAPADGRYTQSGSAYPITINATLSSSTPSRTGYNFLGWSARPSATSASYSAGGVYSYTFAGEQNHTTPLYAVWKAKTYTVSYNKGSHGTGSNQTATKTYNVALTLKNAIFTRTGYVQTGWATSDGGALVHQLGGSYTANAAVTLYPVWSASASTLTLDKSSAIMNGTDTVTVTITRYSNSFTHKVIVSFGSESQTFTNVGTSQSFTMPLNWSAQIPNATNAPATVTVETYNGSTLVGSNSSTFTAWVPGWVKPTVSVSGVNNYANAAVQSWDILVQGYSTITLTATTAGAQGSTVTNIVFSGDGVSQSGTGSSVTSNLLTTSGSKTWTVTVTDSRGRTGTGTLTRTVYEYFVPSISQFTAVRSNSSGVADTVGTYVAAKPTYVIASCDGHNSAVTATISYKDQAAASWTAATTGAASGTSYTIGGGSIAITSWYDVKFELVDAIGNSATYTVQIPTATGASFGLNGQCARFGGPVQYPDRFECDWDAQFDGQIEAPLFLQTGSVASETVEAGTTKTIDITFGREFITNPFVAVSLLSPQTIGMDVCNVSVWNIGKTGFSARLTNGYGSDRSLGVCWIAMARKDVSVSIADQPISRTVDIGDTVVFEVVAVNATNYQWYVMEQYGSNWQEIPGDAAKSPTFTFQAVAAQNGCRYKCVVSNNFGSVESDAATLTIRGVQPVVVVDIAPYLKRASGGGLTIGTRMLLDKVIGGTVCWNQFVKSYATATNNGLTHVYDPVTEIYTLSGTISNTYARVFDNVTVTSGHKYFINADILTNPNNVVFSVSVFSIANQLNVGDGGRVNNVTYSGTKGFGIAGAVNGTNFDGVTLKCNLIDLTKMLGSAIADYIYALEQANAGAGVAWFKALFGDEYHAYAAGTLLSVKTSAHVMKDANNTVIGNYPIDNVDLRGLPKLDANNKLYYDGDEYESDGTVTRNYAIRAYQSGDESLTDAISDGTNTVYKLTTPTTETATAFTNLQVVDPSGTEEYIDGRSVKMPVGHETQYIIS